MPEPRPELLVEPEWLEAQLGNPRVRIFDCTLDRVPQPTGASLWKDGRPGWKEAHIPDAGYLHMTDDLSEPTGSVPYGLPEPRKVADLLSAFGVTSHDTIVLYGGGLQWVVHRCWWVLTAAGALDVRILDGGWERWRHEGRPVNSLVPTFETTTFIGEPRPEFRANRRDVAGILNNPDVCLIHALTAEQFAGAGGQVYGKPGRIPGSVNIPAQAVVDQATKRFRPIDELRDIFAAVGADTAKTIIPYCGGGIAASTVFLALTLAGYDNVRLYDGSLLDWTADPGAPMVTDVETSDKSNR